MQSIPVQSDSAVSNTAFMALGRCTLCEGSGQIAASPCRCVYRRVFRACLGKYRALREEHGWSRRLSVELVLKQHSHVVVKGFKSIEYIADFELVAERYLSQRPLDWRVFCEHFAGGNDWRVCTRRLGINRGTFFHAVYRVEAALGRAFLDLKPYSLLPTAYFSGNFQAERMTLPRSHTTLQTHGERDRNRGDWQRISFNERNREIRKQETWRYARA